jgi:hypothetical protein
MSGDENDRVWSTNRWTITRNGPWHVTVSLRGAGKARSLTNYEAAAFAAALAEAAERNP